MAAGLVPFKWDHLDNIGDVYTPRTGHAVVNEDGVFYLFGGTDGAARQSDVHAYNVETNLWQEIRAGGRAPPARSGAQAVVWNGAVWFFGGYTKKDGDYFNDVYKYEIATSMWGSVHTLGEAPSKRTDHSVVLFRDSLLVFGGFDGHNRFNDLRELHLKDKRWSQVSVRSQVPRNRFGHTAVIYGHSMYIFGGWDGHDTLQELFEYNISSNMWISLPLRGTAPRARYRHTAVVCGDAMFTFGGVDKTQYRFPDLHEYNFTHRHWLKVATMSVQPSARTFHKTVVHEGTMYILGGFDGRRLNDMYRIVLRTKPELQRCQKQLADQASSSPPVPVGSSRPDALSGAVGDAQDAAQTLMPEDLWCWTRIDGQQGQVYTPRTGHAVVVWNHCFYLMGGTDENARQNDIYRFDVRNKVWACVKPVAGDPPSARSGSKAVVCRDSIFFFGGYTKKDGDYFNDLFEFNIPSAHWTRIDSGQKPSVRTDHSCVVYEASLYIFGGFDGRTRFQDLHQFNTEDRDWFQVSETDNMPVGRFGHSAVVYQSSMFVFGGWDGHDTLDDLYEFSITTSQWYSVPGRGDVPPSRYRHSAVVHGCAMFVFGGVDKRQARFSDLCEFSFDTRSWSKVKTTGDPPSARTFHRAVMYGGCMYILGGFDGTRRNDMYKIAVPEQLPRGDEKRRRRMQLSGDDAEAAAEPEIGEVEGPHENNKETSRLRLQVLELQKRLESELERHLCKICFEREINTVILDCSHRAVCSRCLDQVTTCPLCRADIRSTVITYNA
ncbi:unnamed protein product [Effrenium voratum]|uniref:RING-type domain-containing protein n=1 Tax=Effrenium voratum TaxID=2562239 RepID=A0AA36JNS0_9DINO|nr:unnamed protein product [Effrenium voratum]CAJ1408971.1 unnamed protein product [Effrenium voratum]